MAFAAPANSGDILGPADILGHLLICIATDFKSSIATIHGDSDAIVVDVAVLTQTDTSGQPTVYRDVMWFNVSLRNTLRKQIGQPVLARMGQGEGKKGQNPPFILIDATQDAQSVAFAEAWMDQHPEFETEAKAKIGGPSTLSAPTPAVPPVPQRPAVPPVPQPPAAPPTLPAPAPGQPPVSPQVLAALTPEQQALLAQLQNMGDVG